MTSKVDFQKFMQVIDKCDGDVYIATSEGDKINVKSKLSQLIGFSKIIVGGEIEIQDITTKTIADSSRITRFLIYNEV